MWNIRKIVKKGDYLYAVVPEHPKAIKYGYVLEHRVVMENHLERLLNADEIVHHRNGNRRDNRLENLEVTTNSEHVRHHGLAKGRMRVVLKCPACGSLFEQWKNQVHIGKGRTYKTCSNRCRGRFSRKLRIEGATHEVEAAISGNIVREYRYFHDNSEETADAGSVETVRSSPETVKIQSSPQHGTKTVA